MNGCEPPAFILPYKSPLALDAVKRGVRASRQRRLLPLVTKYSAQLGPTVELNLLSGTGLGTTDPENIKILLSTHFDDFHLGPRSLAMMAIVGEGILTQDGAAWKRSRQILERQFIYRQHQNLEDFREHIEKMIESVRNTCSVVDLQPFSYRLTLKTTTAIILGQSVDNFPSEIADSF